MISYERELNIDNKLNNYLKITGILNNVFRPQKNPLTLSVRTEYIYSVASQATSPAPFKYLFNKYPYWIF
jgi:hypothetical protein